MGLLAWRRGLTPTLLPGPHLCPAVPRLLAFLPRPLSNSREEADGPGFLCTNQGGICSLTDTSPLTHVSSHIHYSSSARWASVKGSEQSGGWADNRERIWGAVMSACLGFSRKLIAVWKCLSFSYEDSRCGEAFRQTHRSPHCAFIAFPRTVSTIFISFLLWWQWEINHLDSIISRMAELAGHSSAALGSWSCLKVRWKIFVKLKYAVLISSK